MKVKLAEYQGVFGIELTAECQKDEDTLQRFWKGGVKVNAITPRQMIYGGTSLQLTFADLFE